MVGDMQEVEVMGVRIELPANQPVVLLKSTTAARYLPIWIGAPEANAIALALQGFTPQRPLTHQLLIDTIEHFGSVLDRVEVTGREGHIYIGTMVFDDGTELDCRPSDGIVLALTAQVPVLAADELLSEPPDDVGREEAESEVAQFREFLDQVSADDFEPEDDD